MSTTSAQKSETSGSLDVINADAGSDAFSARERGIFPFHPHAGVFLGPRGGGHDGGPLHEHGKTVFLEPSSAVQEEQQTKVAGFGRAEDVVRQRGLAIHGGEFRGSSIAETGDERRHFQLRCRRIQRSGRILVDRGRRDLVLLPEDALANVPALADGPKVLFIRKAD